MTQTRKLLQFQMSPSINELFKPCRTTNPSLQVYGIQGHIPSFCARVCLFPETALTMHERMLSLAKHQVTKVGKTFKLKLPKNPPWANIQQHDLLQPATHRMHDRASANALPFSEHCQPVLTKPDSLLLACPTCTQARECANRALYARNAWQVISCSSCGRGFAAWKWRCACGVSWASCHEYRGGDLHVDPGTLLSKMPTVSRTYIIRWSLQVLSGEGSSAD